MCTILVLILLLTVTVITVLTYRYHKKKTMLCATQHASNGFDMDSNQACTTQEETKTVECIEQGWANKMKHSAKTAKEHSPVDPMDICVHKINTTPRPPLLT